MTKRAYYKKPWLGAILVLLFGPFGFLYYSFRKALVVFILFFVPNLFLPSYGWLTIIIGTIVYLGLAAYAFFDISEKKEKIDQFFAGIMTTTMYPIFILNFFGELVGGIWLLFIGEWKLAIGAFIFSMFVPMLISLPFLLQAVFGIVVLFFQKRGYKTLTMITAFISSFYGHAIILIYVFFVAQSAISIGTASGKFILPFLLFGYGIATSPFAYMAKNESSDSIGTILAVYLSQISYIVLVVSFLTGYPALALSIILFLTFSIELLMLSIINEEADREKLQIIN